MGIITRVFHRSNGLSDPPGNQLWLDIEENIHIHFRDLRIELGRKEFEEFYSVFFAQAEELLKIVKDTNYTDGVFSNMGNNRQVINTTCNLEKPIKYNSNTLSLEDCTDGYHFHYRNYKLLLKKNDINLLIEALRNIDLDADSELDEFHFLELLLYNDIEYAKDKLNANGPTTVYVKKSRALLLKALCKALKLSITGDHKRWSIKNSLFEIYIKFVLDEQFNCYIDPIYSLLNSKHSSVRHIPLTTYLICRKNNIDRNHINILKCQALETFEIAAKEYDKHPINLDYREWIYDLESKKIIFPFSHHDSDISPWDAYIEWEQFLMQNQLFFIKPTKSIFPDVRQREIVATLEDQLITWATESPAIEQIYVLGSTATLKMGTYTVPFVHFNWCKLASDLDVYIEIDEKFASEIPRDWKRMRDLTKASADYYHLDDIPMEVRSKYFDMFPHIHFYQHLVEALLYFPSKMDKNAKEEFLSSRPHELIYSKTIRNFLRDIYSLDCVKINKMDEIVVRNELYKIETSKGVMVLKIFNCGGGPNYLPNDTLEHCIYETHLINYLTDRGFLTPKVISPVTGDEIARMNGYPVILYEYIDGCTGGERSAIIHKAATTLANMQLAQESSMNIEQRFDLFFGLDIWINIYRTSSRVRDITDGEILTCLRFYDSFIARRDQLEKLLKESGIKWLHNQGDITPSNFIFNGDRTYLVDFQGAYFGPRISDLAEGALEFGLDHDTTNKRYFINKENVGKFITTYSRSIHLTNDERRMVPVAFAVTGFLKFMREVLMLDHPSNKDNHRRNRALAFTMFISEAIEHLGWSETTK